MSSISSIGNYYNTSSYYTTGSSSSTSSKRPSSDEIASELFSVLDSSGKGYIEESDLASALSSLSGTSSTTSSSTSSASDIFSQLDSNGDGKVTASEMSASLTKLADQLDTQFNQSRMQDATGSMPPPPPPTNDTGFTQDELEQQLSEISSSGSTSDSQRADLISNIVNNFSAADTNGDGKVTFDEAMSYQQSTTSATSSSSSSSSSTSTSSDSSSKDSSTSTQTTDAQMFRQLMDLLRLYGDGTSSNNTLSSLSSLISTSA
ncbi:EF-hand domain-containing protein [Propionivibrio dicarboxylicus]|uniref:EF hand n=1 Tax=Propionivibrio dicarboxylicus TaxID=83767 RepID=A0A1G7WH43_9RHOO|nr:EF-hand domain-containing protein [Propionivibrio dicarboxylicus]SDG71218.1 EF hand [Propionivibrio dicarboxylicus]